MLPYRSMCVLGIGLLVSSCAVSHGQAPKRHSTAPEVSPSTPASVDSTAVLLSDLHLDPFHDPAKFPQLLAGCVVCRRGR